MFWKKKRNSSEICSYTINNQRFFFRVCPSETEPIVFEFGGKKVRVIDIGGGGVSFKNDNFLKGESHSMNFDLPRLDTEISAVLEIVKIDRQNICHCCFAEIEEEAAEDIQKYVLERQKEDIQAKKKKKAKERRPGYHFQRLQELLIILFFVTYTLVITAGIAGGNDWTGLADRRDPGLPANLTMIG